MTQHPCSAPQQGALRQHQCQIWGAGHCISIEGAGRQRLLGASTTAAPPPRPLARPDRDAVKELVLPRSRAPLACRAVAGLEGRSQAVLHRNACVRKTFAGSFAAVKKRSVCAQLKLQAVSAGAGTLVAAGWGVCRAAYPDPALRPCLGHPPPPREPRTPLPRCGAGGHQHSSVSRRAPGPGCCSGRGWP